MKRTLLSFVLLFAFIAPGSCFAQLQPLPVLTARLVDDARILTVDERKALVSQLRDLELQYGVQIAVLTVTTTQPESIEQYAVRVFESWQLGNKKRDDGLLLVIAKNDKRVRIEVGYGIEGVIPDVIGRRIIDARLSPAFREGRFGDGIAAALQAIGNVIGGSGEFKAGPAPEAQLGFVQVAFFGLCIGGFLSGVSKILGITGSSATSAILGFTSGLSWPLILLAMVVSSLGAAIFSGAPASSRGGGGFRGGGWSGGGGGWSGGGSGGSIFSGGGGSSGGGGASGSW